MKACRAPSYVGARLHSSAVGFCKSQTDTLDAHWGELPRRENDALGVFRLLGEFSNDLRLSQREAHVDVVQAQEAALEVNYQYEATALSYLQQDTQYVIRPDGTGTTRYALVLGIQVGLTL